MEKVNFRKEADRQGRVKDIELAYDAALAQDAAMKDLEESGTYSVGAHSWGYEQNSKDRIVPDYRDGHYTEDRSYLKFLDQIVYDLDVIESQYGAEARRKTVRFLGDMAAQGAIYDQLSSQQDIYMRVDEAKLPDTLSPKQREKMINNRGKARKHVTQSVEKKFARTPHPTEFSPKDIVVEGKPFAPTF